VNAPDALAVIAAGHDRSKFLGGSDIAAVLGISPWRTPLQLWQDKTTPRVEGTPKKVFTRGQRWEAVVAEMLVEDLTRRGHKVEILRSNTRYQDEDLSFLAAEIDFELRLDDADEVTNCELKTVHPFRMREWGDTGSDDLPVHYTAQVMHGLGVTRRRSGMLAALFGADELRTYPVAADDETIAGMRAQALAFWNDHVLAGLPPAPKNLADLGILFGKEAEGPPLLADPELAARVMQLRALLTEIKAREAEAEAVEFDIKRAMREASEIVMPNGKSAVEWKSRKGSWLDEAALKEAHPAIAREFTRKWESRVFKLKQFDTKGL
jgi:putative phage-type endonuclease